MNDANVMSVTRVTFAGSIETTARIGNKAQRDLVMFSCLRENASTGTNGKPLVPSRCHALWPGAAKTVLHFGPSRRLAALFL